MTPKHPRSAPKTARHAAPAAHPDSAAGPAGVALAPPAYGVDAADRQPMQMMAGAGGGPASLQPENRTGLPDHLKAGVERLSGMAMDDVRVHFNSARPAQLHALAYTQGADIHVGPGQERHLPHEAWHVVQQKQGRVQPTMQLKGAAINDDRGLEREADMLGEKAAQLKPSSRPRPCAQRSAGAGTVQLKTAGAVKNELTNGGILSNFTGQFIRKHVGDGTNTNAKAAKVHAARDAPQPVTNTVIRDARAFKTAISAGHWQARLAGGWRVTSNVQVELQSTTRRALPFDAQPAGPQALPADASDPEKITVENQEVTAVPGVTVAELALAKAAKGAYPSQGQGAKLKAKKRAYREGLVGHVRGQRAQAYDTALANWIQANFQQVGATNLPMAGSTLAQINNIAHRSEQVIVGVNDDGDINHFEGYV